MPYYPRFWLHHFHCILCVQVKGLKNPIGQVESNEQRGVFTGGSDCSFSSTDSKRHVLESLASKIQENASVTERLAADSPWSTTSASSSGQIAPSRNATRKGLERAGGEKVPLSNTVEVLQSILRGWHSVSKGVKSRTNQARQEDAGLKRSFNEKGPFSGPRQRREAEVSEREAGEQRSSLEWGQGVQAGRWEDLQGWAAQVSFTQDAVLAHCNGWCIFCHFCGRKLQLLYLMCKRGLLSKCQRRQEVTAALLTIFWPPSDYLLISLETLSRTANVVLNPRLPFCIARGPPSLHRSLDLLPCIYTRQIARPFFICTLTSAHGCVRLRRPVRMQHATWWARVCSNHSYMRPTGLG
jgi:hypothetical protein